MPDEQLRMNELIDWLLDYSQTHSVRGLAGCNRWRQNRFAANWGGAISFESHFSFPNLLPIRRLQSSTNDCSAALPVACNGRIECQTAVTEWKLIWIESSHESKVNSCLLVNTDTRDHSSLNTNAIPWSNYGSSNCLKICICAQMHQATDIDFRPWTCVNKIKEQQNWSLYRLEKKLLHSWCHRTHQQNDEALNAFHCWRKSQVSTLRSRLTITWGASRSLCKNPCFRRRLRVDGCIKNVRKFAFRVKHDDDEFYEHQTYHQAQKEKSGAAIDEWVLKCLQVWGIHEHMRACANVARRAVLQGHLICSFLKLQLRNTWDKIACQAK